MSTEIVTPGGKTCAYEGCDRPATTVAQGRDGYYPDSRAHPAVAAYCESHAEAVADERSPEYTVACPNCDCRFGVN